MSNEFDEFEEPQFLPTAPPEPLGPTTHDDDPALTHAAYDTTAAHDTTTPTATAPTTSLPNPFVQIETPSASYPLVSHKPQTPQAEFGSDDDDSFSESSVTGIRPANTPKQGPRKIKHYDIQRSIGHGGMAEVYLGNGQGPRGFQQKAAIKLLHPHVSKDQHAIEMFIHEAKITAQLQHPNIVRIYDFGEEQGEYFIIMEYIDGLTLKELIKTSRREHVALPFPVYAYITAQVLDALHYAHSLRDRQGRLLHLIHRDLTPSNIIISHEGEVKLLDFGIAKSQEQEHLTRVGTIKGKYRYLSPEQFKGLSLDRRADIFSMGILLFESTLQRHLFPSSDLQTTMRAVCQRPIPRPSKFHPHYPPMLEQIVLKALARNPGRRFQSAEEMASALRAYIVNSGQYMDRTALKSNLRSLAFEPLFENELDQEDVQIPETSVVMRSPFLDLPSPLSEPAMTMSMQAPVNLQTVHSLPPEPIQEKQSDPLIYIALFTLLLALVSTAVTLWFFLSQD